MEESYLSPRPSPTSIFESQSDYFNASDSPLENEESDDSVATVVPVQLESVKPNPSPDRTEKPKPFFHFNSTRPELYRVFSDDEEPVLRKTFEAKVPESQFKLEECGDERILFFDMRDGVPRLEDACNEVERMRPEDFDSLEKQHNGAGPVPSKDSHEIYEEQKNKTNVDEMRCKPRKQCPYEMRPKCVSMDEFSDLELRMIRGMWKTIKFDPYMFGSLVTLNLFEIIGHLKDADQRATPEALQHCKILLPHAKMAMEGLNRAVEKLQEPWKGQDVMYEMGKAHDRLKIDISREQCELVVNAFLLTLSREVHPKLTLKEMSVMRRFLRTVMNLLVEGSRWDRTPAEWQL